MAGKQCGNDVDGITCQLDRTSISSRLTDIEKLTSNLCGELKTILNKETTPKPKPKLDGVYQLRQLWIVNPLEYAMKHHQNFIHKLPKVTEVLFVGMNPSPKSPTGIPFYDPNPIGKCSLKANFLQWIESDKDMIAPSSKLLWEVIESFFGGSRHRPRFFEKCFITNFCPLIFMKRVKGPRGKEKWKNLPVDKLPDSLTSLWIELMVPCRKALSQMVKCLKPNLVVAVGDYAKKRVKETVDDSGINPKYRVLPIRHPGSVYHRKQEEGNNQNSNHQIPLSQEEVDKNIEAWTKEVSTKLKENSFWSEVIKPRP